MNFCDEFYFCIDCYSMTRWTNERRDIASYEEKTKAGLLEIDGKIINKFAYSLLKHETKNREEINFTIIKSLSRKLIFGY